MGSATWFYSRQGGKSGALDMRGWMCGWGGRVEGGPEDEG